MVEPLKLLPFQAIGAAFLSERSRAYLADAPRLGKTIQAISAVNRVNPRSVHVTAPATAVPNWRREIGVWADDPGIWTVSSWGVAARRAPPMAEVHIPDEAHKANNPDAQRSRAMLGKDSPALRADALWPLSGTPAPNNVWELWHWASKLGLTKLDRYAFLNRYCVWREGDYGPRVVGVRNAAELQAVLAPAFLRRVQADVLKDLPPVLWSEIWLEAVLDSGQVPDATLSVDEGTLPRLDEHMARARRILGEAKAPPLAKFLAEELSVADGKLVVFAHHRSVLDILSRGLADFGQARIDGSTRDRNAELVRFGGARIAANDNGDPNCRVFLGQLEAAGEAIDLSVAQDLVLAEMSWTPSVNFQASQRIQGFRQKLPCRIRAALIPGTLDEVIIRTQARKARALAAVFPEEALAA